MSLIKSIFIFPIKVYKKVLSPLLPPACRYEPTCSQYMIGAIEEWGAFRGLWMGLCRIGRCNPWGGCGHDPVPTNPSNKKT
jgi:putative membrane protein insertion efficiency factor